MSDPERDEIRKWAHLVALIDDGDQEYLDERSAIREYDGGQLRAEAEFESLVDLLIFRRRRGLPGGQRPRVSLRALAGH